MKTPTAASTGKPALVQRGETRSRKEEREDHWYGGKVLQMGILSSGLSLVQLRSQLCDLEEAIKHSNLAPCT